MPKPIRKTANRKVTKGTNSAAPSRSATIYRRTNTKLDLILKLLGRANGATLKELAAATSWQDHSVRGYLSGTLKKKMGLTISSEVIDGTRRYKINRVGIGQ